MKEYQELTGIMQPLLVKNNEFVVGNPKGFISTFYKPSRGINYWKDEVKRYEIFRGNYD